jgi:hypothetical protein
MDLELEKLQVEVKKDMDLDQEEVKFLIKGVHPRFEGGQTPI